MNQIYKVIHEKYYLDDFTKRVNQALSGGYQLVGGIAADADGYYQAVCGIEYSAFDKMQLRSAEPGSSAELVEES